jgi:hypothetical protein
LTGAGSNVDQANAVAISPDSQLVYVSGLSFSELQRADAVTIAYSAG